MAQIHPTAIVEDGAEIAVDVDIGAYCCIGANVILEKGVQLMSHVVVSGHTKIGPGVKIHQFAAVGTPPQDLKYAGEETELLIGGASVIREHVTVHPGTGGGGGVTRVGTGCLLMVGCHIAHDCQIGDQVILVNNVLLGGHVEIGANAIVGGHSAIHQFVRIGQHAMIGGASGIVSDVIPYGMATGNRAHLNGLNLVGLRRGNFARAEIHGLRAAYKQFFGGTGLITKRLRQLKDSFPDNALVNDVVDFILQDTSRALCQPNSNGD